MTAEKLKKANEIQEDISYLKAFLFINETASKETRDDFDKWKKGRIKQLEEQFKKL